MKIPVYWSRSFKCNKEMLKRKSRNTKKAPIYLSEREMGGLSLLIKGKFSPIFIEKWKKTSFKWKSRLDKKNFPSHNENTALLIKIIQRQ